MLRIWLLKQLKKTHLMCIIWCDNSGFNCWVVLNHVRHLIAVNKMYRVCLKIKHFLRSFPGARCSSAVRAFAHDAMGRWTNPSWWTHWAISRSSRCSTTGITKALVCAILSGMVHIKKTLLLIGKSSLCGGSGFPFSLSEWSFTICLMPYNRR